MSAVHSSRYEALGKFGEHSRSFHALQTSRVLRVSKFVDHLYDYRTNWTPLSPITIILIGKGVTYESVVILLISSLHTLMQLKLW